MSPALDDPLPLTTRRPSRWLPRLLKSCVAAVLIFVVGSAVFNFWNLSVAKRPIRALGGTVYTSGDGMGDLAGPNAVMTVEVIGRREFDDSDLAELVPMLKSFPNLRTLRLRGTSVSDDGLKELQHVKTLRLLDVKNTRVSERGIAVLQDALPRLTIEK